MQRKLALTVCVLLVTLGGVAGQTAQASSLRLTHKPWSTMTTHQKVVWLGRQIHRDNSIVRFWSNHNHLDITWQQVHWAKTSLRIATKSLHKLTTTTTTVTHGGNIPQIVCQVFGSQCAMALKVGYRESRFCTCAVNGQYLGIFQMGSSERAKFATSGYSTAYEQIIAAHNYFLVSGWSPWSQTAY